MRLCTAAVGISDQHLAVETEANRAMDVSPQRSDMGALELLKNLLARMVIIVVQSAGDDGPLRRDSRKKSWPC
jgi:hypothetical protein